MQTLLDVKVTCDTPGADGRCHYNLVVEGFSSSEGEYTVSMNCEPAGYQPQRIACGGTVSGSTVGAGSTYVAFNVPVRSLVQFDACASDFDTYLMILNTPTRQALWQCDNCGSCAPQTMMDTILDAGDYLIAIEGAGRVQGNFGVTMNCPPNDFQEGSLTCGTVVHGNTIGAADLGLGTDGGDHMYTFTVSQMISIQMNSCGSAFDTHLRVTNPDLSPLAFCTGSDCDCDDVSTQAIPPKHDLRGHL